MKLLTICMILIFCKYIYAVSPLLSVFWRCVSRGDVEVVLSENFESDNQFPLHDNASELKFIFRNSEFNNDTGNKELLHYEYYVSLAHADPVSTNA